MKKNSTTDPAFGPGHKEKKGKFSVEVSVGQFFIRTFLVTLTTFRISTIF